MPSLRITLLAVPAVFVCISFTIYLKQIELKFDSTIFNNKPQQLKNNFESPNKKALQQLIEASKDTTPRNYSNIWLENFHHDVLKKSQYVVLSASIPNFSNNTNFINERGQPEGNKRAWGYIFQLPNTARVWLKIGYTPIVIITIDYPNLSAGSKILLSIIKREIASIKLLVFYFCVPSYLKVRLSQMLRLIPSAFNIFPNKSFIMTSDADLWPGNPSRYEFQKGKKLHITNHACCGSFPFKGKRYPEYPMSTISMSVKLWNQLLPFQQFITFNQKHFRFNFNGFYEYLKEYANGKNINLPAKHGGELWNIDQVYISIKIGDYINKNGNGDMSYFPKFKCRRLDAWDLKTMKMGQCFDDAHVHKIEPWKANTWKEMNVINIIIFNETTVALMDSYSKIFREAFQTFQSTKNIR